MAIAAILLKRKSVLRVTSTCAACTCTGEDKPARDNGWALVTGRR